MNPPKQQESKQKLPNQNRKKSIINQKKLIRKMTNYLQKKFSTLGDLNKRPEDLENPIELNEDEELPPRYLYPKDPNAPKVLVNFNYITRELQKEEMVPQMVVHFQQDGHTILKDSQIYKDQEELLEERKNSLKQIIKSHEIGGSDFLNYNDLSNYPKEEKEARKILRNKFNYSEVGIQSRLKVIREKGVSTSKPMLLNFSGEVNQAKIFKLYMDHCKKHKMERLIELGHETKKEKDDKKQEQEGISSLDQENSEKPIKHQSSSFNRCLKITERMIVQNNETEKYKQYKYLFTKNKPDLIQTDKKLVVLWKFHYQPTQSQNITSLIWNTKYQDLFAASYGSYTFGEKYNRNSIAIFSLKNSQYPEKIINLEEAAMALDFHPTSPALLCVGLDNGNVAVYDIRRNNDSPIYKSSVKSKKHSDPVWQVKWSPDPTKLNFYSISSDGRVLNWFLMKDLLECEEIYKLKLMDKKNKNKENEYSLTAFACGICFDFSPSDPFQFVVGTEEGNIHLCCTAYSGDYQETYEGHQLAVYKVKFNPFDSETFLSASADWSVKIWNIKNKQALLIFEMSQAIVDIVWSPFNSCVFIALAVDKVFLFDLKKDRHVPISDTIVKIKMTNIAINWNQPIILLGDQNGAVSCMKISDQVIDPNVNVKDDKYRQSQIKDLRDSIKLGCMTDQIIQIKLIQYLRKM